MRLGWGLYWGWFSAAGLSLFVIVQAVAGGTTYFSREGISLAQAVGGYWVAGTLIGVVLAFAHPLIRSRLGSFVLGFGLCWLAYAATGVVGHGWSTAFLLFALIPGLLVGGGLGVVFYDKEHPAPPDVRLTRKESKYHFVEWFAAIHLFQRDGVRSLMEKYVFRTHPTTSRPRSRPAQHGERARDGTGGRSRC